MSSTSRTPRSKSSHAIVMGGSIAGLCAAAALARRFDRVTVLERDSEPRDIGPRRGTPQARHPHALLGGGQRAMADLFPGVFEELLEAGAIVGDLGTRFQWFLGGAWLVRGEVGITAYFQSRPLLEQHLRNNLRRRDNVELRFGAAIQAPIHERGRVWGVRLAGGERLSADVVVDATGRGSRSTAWLADWGYGEVPEQRVELGLTYVTGRFEPPPGCRVAAGLGVYQDARVNKRAGIALRVEGGDLLVTMMGCHGEKAPMDLAGYIEWAKTLARPDIYELVRDARLRGGLRKHTYPFQRRRCFDQLRRLPDRYLVLGDALCSFDPTFGQGMTVASLQAQLLTGLRPGKATRRMQRRIVGVTDVAWSMTATEVRRWSEEARGWEPSFGGVRRAYMAKVIAAASFDLTVYRALMQVMHFQAHPATLFAPGILWRALVGARGGARRLAQGSSAGLGGELSSAAPSPTGY